MEISYEQKPSYLTVQNLRLNALQNVLFEIGVVEGPVLNFCCDLYEKLPVGNVT